MYLSSKLRTRTFISEGCNRHNYHKHLGVTLSWNGTWNKHIENTYTIAMKRVDCFRGMKLLLGRKQTIRHKLYFTFVRPLLEYGDVLWDKCTQARKDRLGCLFKIISRSHVSKGNSTNWRNRRTNNIALLRRINWWRVLVMSRPILIYI